MSGVEIDFEGRQGFQPGLRVEFGLEELRDQLCEAGVRGTPVTLHLGDGDEVLAVVEHVGAGVVTVSASGDAEDERRIVPLDKVLWARVSKRG